MTTYAYTILYVPDVEKTIAFYSNAFDFALKFMTPEKDYAELDTGATTISFASYGLAEYNGISIEKVDAAKNPPAFELGFVVDDVESAIVQALAAGATLEKEAVQKPWGQIVGYVRDVNGFLVEVCTRVEE